MDRQEKFRGRNVRSSLKSELAANKNCKSRFKNEPLLKHPPERFPNHYRMPCFQQTIPPPPPDTPPPPVSVPPPPRIPPPPCDLTSRPPLPPPPPSVIYPLNYSNVWPFAYHAEMQMVPSRQPSNLGLSIPPPPQKENTASKGQSSRSAFEDHASLS